MNTLQKQFSDALKREGKIITTYYKNESVTCLFRKNSDNNSTDEHLTIFYDITTPIKQGQLLSYGGKTYITLNQESVENDAYYKSSCVQCNCTLPVIVNGVNQNIPAYAPDLTSLTVNQGNVISTLDGYGKLYTEYKDILDTSNLIDKVWNMLGWWFEVVNAYVNNNICIIGIQMTQRPTTYTVDLTASTSSLNVGETLQTSAIAYAGDSAITGQTFTYISSDTSIATVDTNGVVNGVATGTVAITVTWVEKNVTDALNLTVASTGGSNDYTLTIQASGQLVIGGLARTYTPSLKDSVGNSIPFTPVWSFNYNGMPESDFSITYVDNQCKIQVAENYDIIDLHLIITCTTDDGLYSANYDATITA